MFGHHITRGAESFRQISGAFWLCLFLGVAGFDWLTGQASPFYGPSIQGWKGLLEAARIIAFCFGSLALSNPRESSFKWGFNLPSIQALGLVIVLILFPGGWGLYTSLGTVYRYMHDSSPVLYYSAMLIVFTLQISEGGILAIAVSHFTGGSSETSAGVTTEGGEEEGEEEMEELE